MDILYIGLRIKKPTQICYRLVICKRLMNHQLVYKLYLYTKQSIHYTYNIICLYTIFRFHYIFYKKQQSKKWLVLVCLFIFCASFHNKCLVFMVIAVEMFIYINKKKRCYQRKYFFFSL